MSDNGKKLILKAEYNNETKQIQITRESNHIPSLSWVIKQLDYDLTELIAQDRVEKEAKRVRIHAPDNIINRLRGNIK